MGYLFEEKPSFLALLLYGLQWWTVSLPAVAVIGAFLAKTHYPELSSQIFYLQKLVAIAGLMMVVQVCFGHKLPLVVGPASVLLVGVVASLSSGISATYSSIALGGAALALCACCGVLRCLHVIFTPRVLLVILMLIAISLSPVIVKLIFPSNSPSLFNLLFSLTLSGVLLFGTQHAKGPGKAIILFLGLFLGTWVYVFWRGGDSFFFSADTPAQMGLPIVLPDFSFEPGTVLSFFFCFIALALNEIASIEAVGHMLQADSMPGRVRRGVAVTGLANMFSGVFGVIGCVDFSLSAGLIAANRCASKIPLCLAGLALFVCAFFPSCVRLMLAIPGPVMGGLLLYLMSAQLAAALEMALRSKSVHDFSSALVVAFPLMVGILVAFAPHAVFDEGLSVLAPLLGNSFVMGCLSVLVLEHIFFRAV